VLVRVLGGYLGCLLGVLVHQDVKATVCCLVCSDDEVPQHHAIDTVQVSKDLGKFWPPGCYEYISSIHSRSGPECGSGPGIGGVGTREKMFSFALD